MKVYRINQYIPNFKSQDKPKVFGYDDEISKQRRAAIREHYSNQTMPYYGILEKEGRLEKYELDKLINDLCKVPKVDYNLMNWNNLRLYNVKPIQSKLTPNSYRGQSPFENPSSLKTIKKAGVKTIVDLCGYSGFEDVVRKNGLEYHFFRVDDDFLDGMGFSTDNDLDNFVKFIRTMQKDHVYIGCEYGKYKTDNALMLNHFFNPAFEDGSSYVTMFNKLFLPDLVGLYNKLRPEHKKLMGWTKEFDANFMPKLKKVMKELNVWY